MHMSWTTINIRLLHVHVWKSSEVLTDITDLLPVKSM